MIVPAFNEAGTIARVVGSLHHAATVIVVDDGSADDTALLAEAAGAVVVRHDANQGYDAAVNTGLRHAYETGADLLITFDADGQHDAATLSAVAEAVWRHGADVVVGERPRFARFGEVMFALYTRTRYGIRDPLCGLKAFRREVYRDNSASQDRSTINTGLLLAAARAGATVANLPIIIHQREDKARVGHVWKANVWILKAFLRTIIDDLFVRRTV